MSHKNRGVFTGYSMNVWNEIVVSCAYAFLSDSLGCVFAKNWQNWMTSDEVIKNVKRVTFFLRHSVVVLH